MKVALSAQLLSASATYRTAGISRVIYELLAHLPGVPSSLEYLVFAPDSPQSRGLLSTRIQGRLTRLPMDRPVVRLAWEQLAQPLELAWQGVNLVHALGTVAPCAWRGPTVVTLYDLSFMRFPELFKRGNRLYLRLLAPPSLRRASRVIAISEHTRQDAIRLCGVAPERVTAIHLAADPRFRPADAAQVTRFRQQRGLASPFILYLGTLEPRKNVATLVRAYAKLGAAERTGLKLVLAGGRGWQYESIFALVHQLGLTDDVLFPGFVPTGEEALWYTAAEIFAFPSLYEGFGLPLLEAMACGTPVVASNTSSLPEVVGSAGLLVEPTDVHGLAAALQRLIDDDDLRARLRAAGLARASLFSWQRMAEQTVQVYREVFGAA
ncbi:MAG TPA: glycosyltransferase family 1 protein [Chloroflexota bacterium]|nr:glycosyltransferase family 1 protein [Chloroflexota bacterium]